MSLLAVTPSGETSAPDNNYEAIRAALDGATLDHVTLGDGRHGFFVDDEGIYKRLAFNAPASMMAGIVIFGPVVLVGPADDEGNTTEPEERTRKAFEVMANFWRRACMDAVNKRQRIIALANPDTLPPPQIIELTDTEMRRWLGDES